MLPSIESLRCFSEVARLLNFRAAAKVMALTPAAVSQRIRQLEEQVGRPLFTRTTRRVELTEAGLALVPRAAEALEATQRCLAAGRGELGPAPLDLTIGTRHELGMSWLVGALPALEAALPWVTFHLYFGSGDDLLARVRSGEIHCAVGSMRNFDALVATQRLHQERYALVASPALLARTPLRRAEDAQAHTLVDADARRPLSRYLTEAPGGDAFRFLRFRAMGTIAAVRAMALGGRGVAVLPAYLVAADLAARRLVRAAPRQRLASDWFRLYFRADDPRAALWAQLGATLRGRALA